jgi:hypothetical protein
MQGTVMTNLADPPVSDPPEITPLFTELLEQEAAQRGLPPEPWAA